MHKMGIDSQLQRWLAGDETAFNDILKYYYQLLMPNCKRMVSNREDAEEIVMNVMLKMWQHRKRFEAVLNVDDYLYAILRQEITLFSRKKVLPTYDIQTCTLVDLVETPHLELSYQDLYQHYLVALEKLTPKQREVYLFLREEQGTRKELADKTGTSIHTINNHMNAALKVLRQEMRQYPDALINCMLLSSASLYILH